MPAPPADSLAGPRGSQRCATDLRLGGAWGPLQRRKNDALWILACLALGATRRLSVRSLRDLGRTLGVAAHAFCGRARETALANVGLVFPHLDVQERRAFVRRCFATLGEGLGETVALLSDERTGRERLPDLGVSGEAREIFAQARREGRGVVFASAHLGPWERVAAALVASGIPLVTVARESYDPRFSLLYDRLRAAHGVRVVWRASADAATRIVRTLRGGGVLGIPMDLCARVPSEPAPFLGHDAPTPVGPARIALRTGCMVVVGSAAPGSAGDVMVTATRIPTHDLPRGSHGPRELTARINHELSRRILALPHAWVWMHDRWKRESPPARRAVRRARWSPAIGV